MFGDNKKNLFKFLEKIIKEYFPRKHARILIEKIVKTIIAYSFIWLLLERLFSDGVYILIRIKA